MPVSVLERSKRAEVNHAFFLSCLLDLTHEDHTVDITNRTKYRE